MEIVKTNEMYRISDTKEDKGWEISGTVSKEASGSMWFNFSITKSGEDIGNGNYNKEPNSDRINISYNTSEANEADFVACMKEIIEAVKTNFAE